MKTYITKLIKGFFVSYPEEIDAVCWEGQIGNTLEDFYDGKWVLLSDEQTAFHEANPDADVVEVWNMQLNQATQVDELETAKQNKLAQLKEYDASSNVNDFVVNGTMHAWFIPQERANYRNSIDAAKIMGVDSLQVFVGDTLLTLTTQQAEQMLAAIQLYADQCYIVTRQHKTEIESLQTVQEVNDYDYTMYYPEKLTFTL